MYTSFLLLFLFVVTMMYQTNPGDDDDNNNNKNNYFNNHGQQNCRRGGTGRKKIKIEKIQNKSNLGVTFSKRKAGVIKKTSEIGILTGAQSAIVVFNPQGGKPSSYGYPDFDTVLNRFLSNGAVPVAANPNVGAQQDSIIRFMARKQEMATRRVDHGKARSTKLNKELSRFKGTPDNFNKLGLQQLLRLDDSADRFDAMVQEDTQRFLQGGNVQVLQGTSNMVPPMPIQTNIPFNGVYFHGSTSTSGNPLMVQGGLNSSTPPVYSSSLTFGRPAGGIRIVEPNGINIGGEIRANVPARIEINDDDMLDNLRFTDYMSTLFPGESPGAGNTTNTAGETRASNGTENNPLPGVNGNTTFGVGENGGLSSNPNGNSGRTIPSNDGTTSTYDEELEAWTRLINGHD